MTAPSAEPVFHGHFGAKILKRVAFPVVPVLIDAHGFATMVGIPSPVAIEAGHARCRPWSGFIRFWEFPHMPKPRIDYAFGIRRFNTAGACNTDGFKVFGSENASESSGARADSAAMDQGANPGFRFSDRTDANDLRSCRSEFVADLLPFIAKPGPATYSRRNPGLRFIGIDAP